MKRVLCLATILFAVGVSQAFAQPAPNRKTEVEAFVRSQPPAVETDADDARRALLFDIVRDLAARGDCCWGVLVKTDQGNKIPADVIVWRPTLEHVDVLSGGIASAMWGYKGVVPDDRWIWQAVPDAPVPPPSTPTTPPSSVDLSAIEKRLEALEAGQELTLEALGRVQAAEQLQTEAVAAVAKSLEEHRAEARKVKSWARRWLLEKIVPVLGGVFAGWKVKK